MTRWLNPRTLSTLLALGLASLISTAQKSARPPGALLPNVLYGAAYYNEYMPADLQPRRLEKDVALMKEAGISVVRMGESTWSLWEPADGVFEYAWMDRVVDAMGKAGIKVIMGTPTYSMPTWMAKAHPEFYARPLGGASSPLRHAPERGHRQPEVPLLRRAHDPQPGLALQRQYPRSLDGSWITKPDPMALAMGMFSTASSIT